MNFDDIWALGLYCETSFAPHIFGIADWDFKHFKMNLYLVFSHAFDIFSYINKFHVYNLFSQLNLNQDQTNIVIFQTDLQTWTHLFFKFLFASLFFKYFQWIMTTCAYNPCSLAICFIIFWHKFVYYDLHLHYYCSA